MKACVCDIGHAAHCSLITLLVVITNPLLLEKVIYFIMFEQSK